MKKVLWSIGFGLLCGSTYVLASNNGPYAWDERGAQVTSGLGIAGKTLVGLQGTVPAYTGEMVFCTNCTRSNVCISSGTGTGAWVVLVETGTMANNPTACQ